jgi:nickel-dependent lactate racemase
MTGAGGFCICLRRTLMQIGIDYGLAHADFEVAEGSLVRVDGPAPAAPLLDIAAAVQAALETPLGWPALRQALTPDDHVAVVVDERLPRLPEILVPLLEQLIEARVAADAITLVCPPSASNQAWIDDLPDEYADVQVEVHDPSSRRKLAYLATTRQGRRLYLNRTAVDADQIVVLTGRRYDCVLGYAGAETALYPALSDTATRAEFYARPTLEVPGPAPWPVQAEAREVAWLLGAPFLLQVIEGAGDEMIHVLGGSLDSSVEGQRLLDARWRLTVDRPADLVVASICGNPARHDLTTVAEALAGAARVVVPGGRIVLLTQAAPQLGAASDLIRRADSPRSLLEQLKREQVPDHAALVLWASSVNKAHVYLLSNLDADVAEELFTTPLEEASQAQRLIAAGGSCLVLPDAQKTMAVSK